VIRLFMSGEHEQGMTYNTPPFEKAYGS
jgi:hypothetical protein